VGKELAEDGPGPALDDLIGQRVRLRGHFAGTVRIEGLDRLDGGYHVRVRTDDGHLDETTLMDSDLADGEVELIEERAPLVPGNDLFDFLESYRIDLAYAHDPQFAVSMSGVRGLPHQIVAVYRHMLPQARLRFVLADDPGAGKTIMAGLLVKELRLRGVVDRVLVLCPAPLTLQWQEELEEKFDEQFALIGSHEVKWQLGGNPWQRNDRCIASLDFAKREEVMPDLLRADWDLVIIDEAHKCSASSRWDSEERREKLDRTQRYRLAEELSRRTERLLLATATPHSGDRSRFQNFLRLLDPDQFAVEELAAEQIGREDSPYFLRREKESLKDERGAPLFVERRVLSQPFTLSAPELGLYEAVTRYIQEFLGAAAGRRGNAVALARTVLQRRLASSLGAIRSSLRKRADRIAARIEEVEDLPPGERMARLAELRVVEGVDSEQGLEDATEEEEEQAVEGVVVAETLEGMRAEIAALEQLVRQADDTIAAGEERKLGALRDCLQSVELAELRDGRGKLLIFTEHRDTLEYLVDHLSQWGYSTCSIHGGQPPITRKEIQQLFATERQICVATEAAGEGINLQFCHLMINYDLPWNPVRLEQRMGRIHRIGQDATCLVFNFFAENTVEGKLLARLLEKLDDMRADLGGRVYDVVGEILARSGVDFERLLRESLLSPERVDQGQLEIEAIDPDVLKGYERDIGIAQATKHVDVSWVQSRDWRSEERRLMPEFVEQLFLRASERVGLRLEPRGQDLLRVPHVPRALSSDRLAAVQRLGHPRDSYPKVTFKKDVKGTAEHGDSVLLSPGHVLYAATAEALRGRLANVERAAAPFIAPWVREPYAIHFFTFTVQGLSTSGGREDVHAELVAVAEGDDGPEPVSADVLHDLTPVEFAPRDLEAPDPAGVSRATDYVRARVQQEVVRVKRDERLAQAELRSRYLEEAMDAQVEVLERKWSELEDRVYRGEEGARFARDEADRRLRDTRERRQAKLAGFEQLGVVKPGPVAYLGSALIGPPPADLEEPAVAAMRNDPEVERAAMEWAERHEWDAGWEPEDVSEYRDGRGFDIRSVRRGPDGRELEVRRIEVKGRSQPGTDVSLCRTEWIAANRHRESFWLYVVYAPGRPDEHAVLIQDPAERLGESVREATQVTTYLVPGEAIEAAA